MLLYVEVMKMYQEKPNALVGLALLARQSLLSKGLNLRSTLAFWMRSMQHWQPFVSPFSRKRILLCCG